MTIHHLKPKKAIAAAIDTAEEVESFAALANFSPVEYGQRREALAKQFNIKLTFLEIAPCPAGWCRRSAHSLGSVGPLA